MNISRKFIQMSVVAMLVIFMGSSYADDTEIYTNNTASAGYPLVMFSIDYRPNLGSTVCGGTECDSLIADGYLAGKPTTQFELLKAVLKKVLEPLTGLDVGLMINHDHNNNCAGPGDSGCSGGGYILSGFSPVDSTDSNGNKAAFITKLDGIGVPGGGTSHSYQGKELFFEFFRYLTGQGVYSGHLGYKDFGNSSASGNLDTEKPLAQRDMAIETGSVYNSPTNYVSPISRQCTKMFSVNFMFQVSNQESDADSAILETKANGGMAGISLSGSNNRFSSVLSWLNAVDLSDGSYGTSGNYEGVQNVTSFFVIPGSPNTKTTSYAAGGGTTQPIEWSSDPETLVASLENVFSQIISTSTTFTAASVPVSVLNRAQVVNNVYVALFKADENGKKRWPGNLKKLKLNLTKSHLVDSTDTNAVASDGRILASALTYWTSAGDLPTPDLSNGEVAGKDGRAVERGGAGQITPGFISGTPGLVNAIGSRTMYYEPTSGSTLLSFNADLTVAALLQTSLGAADITEAEVLLQYARGYDVNDENLDGSITDTRSWIVGDPLHSRPLPINYGASSATDLPDIRIIMGSNDGFLRMYKNTTGPSTQLGTETWAFLPTKTMGVIKQLRDNPAGSHPYGVDGTPAAYIHDETNSGVIGDHIDDKAWVFFGLRRGGRAYYGMDVTNPDSPSMLWSINEATAGFSELGYTFSAPTVGKMDWGIGVRPVIIVGGGYDFNKDNLSAGTDDAMGNALYIIDAETGGLVWVAHYASTTMPVYTGTDAWTAKQYVQTGSYGMYDSIPSAVSALDTVGDGIIDRIYVGDTGGVVWRADVGGTGTGVGSNELWTIAKLADLGRFTATSGTAAQKAVKDRRFFHRPDIVQFTDSTGDYDAVVIASGNRAHPLNATITVENWIYMIKDRDTTTGAYTPARIVHGVLGDVTDNCLQDSSCGVSSPSLTYGWKMRLEADGEKSLATPTTLARKIFVTSYVPPGAGAGGSCEPNEGSGRLYALSLADATAVQNYSVLNGDAIETADRMQTLNSAGIPAEVVYISDNKILKPDLSIDNVNSSSRWKSWWYRNEN